MTEIVGVRFKQAGKVYYFDPVELELRVGEHVIVETTRGPEVARVVISPKEVEADDVSKPLKPVLRLAGPEEVDYAARYEREEAEAVEGCRQLIARLQLPMKLLSAEYSLDGQHLTFFFSAEERVDFRQLVRELAGRFRMRVELRQVGARDEAKLLGGFGRCGRQLCCASFLSDFSPISIKMAKEQSLPLNPMKISGVCGRLLCCLSYENDQYRSARQRMPRRGQTVFTAMGKGRVVGGNALNETALVELENGVSVELPLDEINAEPEAVTAEAAPGAVAAGAAAPSAEAPETESSETAADAAAPKTEERGLRRRSRRGRKR